MSQFFKAIKDAADKTGVELAAAANKVSKGVAHVKGKIEEGHQNLINPGERFGPLWEPPENVERCRSCQIKFAVLKNRKINCRECAGVFCDACTHVIASTEVGTGTGTGGAGTTAPGDDTAFSTASGKKRQKYGKKGDNDNTNNEDKQTPPASRSPLRNLSGIGSTLTNGLTSGITNGINGLNSISTFNRICDGCKRGECPGDDIKNAIREQLATQLARLEKKDRKKVAKTRPAMKNHLEEAVDRVSMTLAVKVADSMGGVTGRFVDTPPAVSLKLQRGAPFSGDEDDPDAPPPTDSSAPRSGYFQLTNKSSAFVCVKVVYAGGDLKFEVPRPSYLAVPPGGSVHAFFDEDAADAADEEDNEEDDDEDEEGKGKGRGRGQSGRGRRDYRGAELQVMLLFDNPKDAKALKKGVFYNTARHLDSGKISPCAKVAKFRAVHVYSVAARRQNVVLKYKGKGLLEPRKGSSLRETGLLGTLIGRRSAGGVDLKTNVDGVGGAVFRLATDE